MPLYTPGGGSSSSSSENGWSLSDYNSAGAGFLAWTGNPGYSVPNVAAITPGQIRWNKIWLRSPATITNITVYLTAAGVTLTAAQNFVALFDAAGNQVGISADQSTAWATTGVKVTALTAPYAAAAGGYYIGLLANAATGPIFACHGATGSSSLNNGLGSSALRAIQTSTTNNTAMPASFTVSGQQASAFNFMAALT